MKKTLIILGAALVLLTAILLKTRSVNMSRQSGAYVFDTSSAAEISSLKVINRKDTAQLKTDAGKWAMASDGFPVDTAKIRKVLGYILSLQNNELVSRSSTRLVEYGLDSNEGKHLEWTGKGGKTVRVVIGKTSGADYSSTFWKWEDKPEVYRTTGNFTFEIGLKPADWKSRELFKFELKDVRFIEADWHDSLGAAFHYKLETVNDTTYKLVEPDSSPALRNIAQGIFSQAPQMTIDDFVAPGDTNLAKAGLDSPMVVLQFHMQNGKVFVLKGGRSFESFVYVQHPARKEAIKISTWRFDQFKKKPFELVHPAPAAAPIPPVSKIKHR